MLFGCLLLLDFLNCVDIVLCGSVGYAVLGLKALEKNLISNWLDSGNEALESFTKRYMTKSLVNETFQSCRLIGWQNFL